MATPQYYCGEAALIVLDTATTNGTTRQYYSVAAPIVLASMVLNTARTTALMVLDTVTRNGTTRKYYRVYSSYSALPRFSSKNSCPYSAQRRYNQRPNTATLPHCSSYSVLQRYNALPRCSSYSALSQYGVLPQCSIYKDLRH